MKLGERKKTNNTGERWWGGGEGEGSGGSVDGESERVREMRGQV